MFSQHSLLLILFCLVNIELVSSVCKKSFVTICESLSDVQYNTKKKTWSELLVQKTCAENVPVFTLTLHHLTRDLSGLKWLIIDHQLNKIEKNAFTYCKNLQRLVLYGNDIRTIEQSTFRGFRKLDKLSLENNNIEQMKSQAFLISTIGEVDLSHNKLHVLVTDLFKKSSVETLRITHNQLWQIEPNSLPRGLKSLHLDHNRLDSLPQELTNLKQLHQLTLSHNNWIRMPYLEEIHSLEKLDISFNRITSVSHELNDLVNLRYLDLSGNNLEKFTFTPQFLHNLKDKFYLLLAHNKLRNLNLQPVENVEMVVTLSGNPWNCKCMDEIQEAIKRNNITTTVCDQKIFSSGNSPYCIVDDQRCLDNRVSVSMFEEFKDAFQDDCDVFNDIDTLVN